MTIREKGINDTIRQYGDERGTFTAVFTGAHLYNQHYFINQYDNNQSILFANLYDVNMNISVCPYMFMNWNRTWAKLDLQIGDVVHFKSYSELYRMGQRYHPLSTTRCSCNYFRLKYPIEAEVIGNIEIPDPINDLPVYDLQTAQHFKSFEEYSHNTPFIKNPVDKELLFISLIDGIFPTKIWLNKNGKVNSRNYRPYVIYRDIFDKLSPEQQMELEGFHRIEDNTPVDKIDVLLDKLDKLELRPL